MKVQFFSPHPLLAPYIQSFCYAQLDIHNLGQPLDIHPIGHSAVAFVLNEEPIFEGIDTNIDYKFRFSFTGHVCQHMAFKPLVKSIEMILVSFTCNGAFKLFGLPQDELTNQSFRIDEVLPNALTIKSKLEDHANDAVMVKTILEDWLLRMVTHALPPTPGVVQRACEVIQQRCGKGRIKDLCNELNVTEITLQRHFKKEIGLSPKLFSRIIRFIAINRFIQENAHVYDWQELVYRYDFFDQAHFVKDFKDFFGYTPANVHLSVQNLAKGMVLK
ncbi:AraC family transcriptional regulator [Sphingobacterium sp. SGG-5]|uniref:AraC family transcriptional regulator n=1 Tax=Sphingobacterium sp. SGG-5 TaxID=2710881 RepID=UPI0013EABF73|nr:helix-turn-helix domain-containing protein [Sphingobacterium sp. SGG-5]NGM61062.1 AraC family transcriptional regulator [Sphingobacterium sp. SGG-5]